jgi:hypothetical protein
VLTNCYLTTFLLQITLTFHSLNLHEVLSTVIKKTVDAVHCLSKLEPNNKIRLTWLCCLTYVLQEAPEVLLKKYMLSLCDLTKVCMDDVCVYD